MSHRYQVTIQGKGFSVPTEDGDGIVGFFAICRAQADTPDEAYKTAVRALERESKFRWLVESTRGHTGDSPHYTLRQEDIGTCHGGDGTSRSRQTITHCIRRLKTMFRQDLTHAMQRTAGRSAF